ncbi:hypothetical protein OCS_04854 [Ophiocordyceps sinensis CO18]|uniref:Ketosteroid isomerase-like protein n=1 Tax=Ophiocordyceps sinensis (strain Co18 / CGMCC 3.14243) TaxID=911162 RepID=T5AA15_OPHSC|nr:hypothetical protein OCS_04854 [Ophiocordyceps sinensis CO18]
MAGFVLAKEHILEAFSPLAITDDAAARARFFSDTVAPDPDPDGRWWACVETRGQATRKPSGKPYNNEYIWLTAWSREGRIVEVRSYFDSMLSEEVLREPVD